VSLQGIDYDVMNVPTPKGGVIHTALPLFLVTLARNQKVPEIFKLTNSAS
jgi:hypothetical protein